MNAVTKLSAAAAAVLLVIAEGLAPAPELKISEWVNQGKVVLTEKTNTPRPGPFTFEGVEYIIEPLDHLHPDDPCRRVTFKGGAQTAKSSIGQLWVCWSIENNPKSFAIGLPSDGEVLKYNDYKLQPIIEDSPTLAPRVRPVSTKSNLGSSARKKKLFNGATVLVFNLGSFNELQMISTGNLILEEVANAPKEVGTRGSPIKQARERQAAYSVIGSKELMVSTTGEQGTCEVTIAYELGDERKYYGQCPHCLGHFPLEPEGFKPAEGSFPHHFVCPGCGGMLEYQHLAFYRGTTGARWIATFRSDDEANPQPPLYIAAADFEKWRDRDAEGRQPSYYAWQAYCGLITWDKIAASKAEAKTPADLKALEQQVFGRAYDPSIDALSWEELHRLREDYDTAIVPSGAEILTGFADVQGQYLQWAVYAWGPGAEWWVTDRGIIEGDTAGDDVWRGLDAVTRRHYTHQEGGSVPISAFGVDTGFRTQRAYAFVRGRMNCYALDGRPGWKQPVIGKPKPQKVVANGRVVGRVKLWPTGTWELKSLLAWSLKTSIEAGYKVRVQGRGHWSRSEDEAWTQEMTAEVLAEEANAKTGLPERWWKKIRKNEELDCWVGARALAWMLGVGAPRRDRKPGEAFDYVAAKSARAGIVPQTELFVPAAVTLAEAPQAAATDAVEPVRERRFFRSRNRGNA